jgi:hypothetical protein
MLRGMSVSIPDEVTKDYKKLHNDKSTFCKYYVEILLHFGICLTLEIFNLKVIVNMLFS